jgi:hypothetical protein
MIRMRARGILLAVTILSALLATLPGGAAAGDLHMEYSVRVRGFPVGAAELTGSIEGGRYALAFSGGIRGLARLFSDARVRAEAACTVDTDRLHPEEYSHFVTERDNTESANVRFSGPGVAEIVLDPPRKRPERYVPMTAGDIADALDPVSAFLWPATGGATADVCNRTLPLIDGKERYDIALSFKGTEHFTTRDGSFSGPAIVCALRYVPVSGHRQGSRSVQAMAEAGDMEVWMAAAGEGFVAPVRIRLRIRMGQVVLEARRFEANDGRRAGMAQRP